MSSWPPSSATEASSRASALACSSASARSILSMSSFWGQGPSSGPSFITSFCASSEIDRKAFSAEVAIQCSPRKALASSPEAAGVLAPPRWWRKARRSLAMAVASLSKPITGPAVMTRDRTLLGNALIAASVTELSLFVEMNAATWSTPCGTDSAAITVCSSMKVNIRSERLLIVAASGSPLGPPPMRLRSGHAMSCERRAAQRSMNSSGVAAVARALLISAGRHLSNGWFTNSGRGGGGLSTTCGWGGGGCRICCKLCPMPSKSAGVGRTGGGLRDLARPGCMAWAGGAAGVCCHVGCGGSAAQASELASFRLRSWACAHSRRPCPPPSSHHEPAVCRQSDHADDWALAEALPASPSCAQSRRPFQSPCQLLSSPHLRQEDHCPAPDEWLESFQPPSPCLDHQFSARSSLLHAASAASQGASSPGAAGTSAAEESAFPVTPSPVAIEASASSTAPGSSPPADQSTTDGCGGCAAPGASPPADQSASDGCGGTTSASGAAASSAAMVT
mmetsp:Transcript_100773/g.291379  ORF Transcript_100773/g.291379 Transcript_100773/m.291379 type:complete len:508 (-) Transcript_100773:58-1581(-)